MTLHSTEYTNLTYFCSRGRNQFLIGFRLVFHFHPVTQAALPAIPVSFEMWVVGVQEMHEGRETKLLPILLGR